MLEHPLLSRGETSVVHAWRGTEVVKLFNADVREEAIQYEAFAACEAHEAGIPTPRVSDIVEHEGKRGIVYERVDGTPLSEILRRKPWLVAGDLVRKFADLHAFIHERESSRLRSQDLFIRRMVLNAPNLTPEMKSRNLAVLSEVESSNANTICHNDFHFGNVICTPRGLVVVDWARSARGGPLVDAATTAFKLGRAIRYVGQGPLQHWVATRIGSWLAFAYKRHYTRMEGLPSDLLSRLVPIIATAYQREHVIGLGELRAIMRTVYGDSGIAGLRKWVANTVAQGYSSEEHVNKQAFNLLRRNHPEESLEYGERALVINPENKKLANRVNRLRDKEPT